MSRQEEEYIEEIGRPMYSQQGLAMPDYQVDFHLKDGDLLLGKHEFQILLTPGHSPGSLSIYWPRHKVLVTGDVVFDRGVGRVDFPGGDAKALRQSVERLERLPAVLLIPGHGPALQGEDRVRMNFEVHKESLSWGTMRHVQKFGRGGRIFCTREHVLYQHTNLWVLRCSKIWTNLGQFLAEAEVGTRRDSVRNALRLLVNWKSDLCT